MAFTLTAYYKLDESSGNASDSSGNGNTLVNTGSVTYGAAKINNGAIGTNTTGGYLSIANALGFTSASTQTWTFWYKSGATMSNGYVVDNISNATDHIRFIMYEESATKKLHFFANGNEIVTAALTDATWYFFRVTKNGTSWQVFQNEVSIGTTTTGGLTYSGGVGFALLNSLYSGGSQTTATLDEFGIFPSVLSSTEGAYLYNSGNGRQPPFSLDTGAGFFSFF